MAALELLLEAVNQPERYTAAMLTEAPVLFLDTASPISSVAVGGRGTAAGRRRFDERERVARGFAAVLGSENPMITDVMIKNLNPRVHARRSGHTGRFPLETVRAERV